jgi:hypothetical protein
MIIKRKRPIAKTTDPSEAKINTIIDLIKDLEQADYNRLREGMDLIYKGYQKVRKSKTKIEKDSSEIDKAEEFLETEK